MTISNEKLRLHSRIISVFDTNITDIKAMASELLQARERIAELEKAQEWISVDDELPELNEWVLVTPEKPLNYIEKARMTVRNIWHTNFTQIKVTRWMPLPAPQGNR